MYHVVVALYILLLFSSFFFFFFYYVFLAFFIFFFFQAEDGIRDKLVTGVQTCALPICRACTSLNCSDARRSNSSWCMPCRWGLWLSTSWSPTMSASSSRSTAPTRSGS